MKDRPSFCDELTPYHTVLTCATTRRMSSTHEYQRVAWTSMNISISRPGKHASTARRPRTRITLLQRSVIPSPVYREGSLRVRDEWMSTLMLLLTLRTLVASNRA